MEKSSFFNSVSHDRTYKAEDWAEYFASFIGNGVFPVPSTGLQVVANDGMKLNVKTGKAWINGYFYFNTGDLAVELDTADGQLNRIDRVVVRWDLTNRVMSVKVKSSSFSASPTAPALQRDADIYELALADIYVGAGVTAITQSKITDQRLNTSLCGVVAAVVQQIDTAAFNAQLQAWFAEYQSLSAAEYNTLVSYMNSLKLQGNTQYEAFEQHMADFETQAAADFNAWFNGLQNVLDDNAATNLLNITNALDARVDMLEAVLFNDITTNPFLILFDDLDGVTSTGIWNEFAEDRMLTRYACTAAELSCVIGNIFAELSPPCAACGAEVLQITGTTVAGNAATLTVTEAGFDFDGCADDTAMIERMRKGRCIYAKTGAGAERTDGIQRDCEGERPCKAHLHDHEFDGALPEEIPLHACKQDTG